MQRKPLVTQALWRQRVSWAALTRRVCAFQGPGHGNCYTADRDTFTVGAKHLVVKGPACQSRWKRHRFDPWVGKIPWRREWLPTAVSMPENPTDRGAWWATVHGVAKSRTQLSTHTHTHTYTIRPWRSKDANDCWENWQSHQTVRPWREGLRAHLLPHFITSQVQGL